MKYEVDDVSDRVTHCHCSVCRKFHGAAFATYGRAINFRWLEGEHCLHRFESSPGIARTFCSKCGTSLQFIVEGEDAHVSISLGTLDETDGLRPIAHIYTDSKADWFEITDHLPRHSSSF